MLVLALMADEGHEGHYFTFAHKNNYRRNQNLSLVRKCKRLSTKSKHSKPKYVPTCA